MESHPTFENSVLMALEREGPLNPAQAQRAVDVDLSIAQIEEALEDLTKKGFVTQVVAGDGGGGRAASFAVTDLGRQILSEIQGGT